MDLPNLSVTDHRSWPPPTGRWAWQQQWYDLLFAHWPIDAEQLRRRIPSELELDTFDGTAWIGVVPFAMHIKRRGLPGLPTARHFPELNVRTYVRHQSKAGVWFFSLDAASLLAVWGASLLFHLPYHHADIRVTRQGETIDFRSARRGPSPARFAATYRPAVPVGLAQHGSLEHWLTERYCLFCQSRTGACFCGEIHHEPWPLQQAEAEFRENTMLSPLGLSVPDVEPLLHYARSIDVVLWPLQRVTAVSRR